MSASRTLANALAGAHVAAVSPRPQTTRRRISAVVHGDGWQAVLQDIPGYQTPRDALTERMQHTVDQTLGDCDAVIFVVNAAEAIGGGDRFIAERVRADRAPNDRGRQQDRSRAPRRRSPGRLRGVAELIPDFVAVHPVSALTEDGLEALRAESVGSCPRAPPTSRPNSRPTRPTTSGGRTDPRGCPGAPARRGAACAGGRRSRNSPPSRGRIYVEAAMLVDHESQKGIVIGKGGQMIRAHRHRRPRDPERGVGRTRASGSDGQGPARLAPGRLDAQPARLLGRPARLAASRRAARVRIYSSPWVLSAGNAYCGPLKDAGSDRPCARVTPGEIARACDRARAVHVASVRTAPRYTGMVARRLGGSDVRTCAVIIRVPPIRGADRPRASGPSAKAPTRLEMCAQPSALRAAAIRLARDELVRFVRAVRVRAANDARGR